MLGWAAVKLFLSLHSLCQPALWLQICCSCKHFISAVMVIKMVSKLCLNTELKLNNKIHYEMPDTSEERNQIKEGFTFFKVNFIKFFHSV